MHIRSYVITSKLATGDIGWFDGVMVGSQTLDRVHSILKA